MPSTRPPINAACLIMLLPAALTTTGVRAQSMEGKPEAGTAAPGSGHRQTTPPGRPAQSRPDVDTHVDDAEMPNQAPACPDRGRRLERIV